MNRFVSHSSRNGVVDLVGKVVTGSTGALGTTSHCEGFTVAKTGSETGRYTFTLQDSWANFWGISITPVGAADAAWTGAKGIDWFVRNVDMAAKTIDVQFSRPVVTTAVETTVTATAETTAAGEPLVYTTAVDADAESSAVNTPTNADAELPDSTTFYVVIKVSDE